MLRTNLTIVLIVLGTLAVYTAVANMIPQVESEVPAEITIAADVTPEQLVTIGEELYAGAGGCMACHGLGTRAPDLLGVAGSVCEMRQPGVDCKEYLYQSLVNPSALVVEGFQPIMPDMSRTLTDPELWAIVAFLQSQGGEVTVTAADISTEGESGAGEVAAVDVTGDPIELLRVSTCLACHQVGGEGIALGPSFDELSNRDPEFIRNAILFPNADTAAGFETFAGTMPANFGETLSEEQLEAIVAFLAGDR